MVGGRSVSTVRYFCVAQKQKGVADAMIEAERVMYAPIMDFRALMGVGPRVAEHAINTIPVHPFLPLEEIRLK